MSAMQPRPSKIMGTASKTGISILGDDDCTAQFP